MSERAELITPDLEDVQQQDEHEEYDLKDVPVSVSGPIQTHRLPSRVSVMRSFTLTDTAELIAGRDLRRARMLILAIPNDSATAFYLGTDNASVAAETAARIPVNLWMPALEHSESIYGKALSGESVTLSIIIEQWAD